MSESEISDLEQQIASGRLVKSYAGRSTNNTHQRESLLDEEHEANDEAALDDQENKAASFYREAHGISMQANERMEQQMCGSTSMPSILYVHQRPPNYWGPGYVTADFWRSEYPIGEEQQDGSSEEANGRISNMHRSLTVVCPSIKFELLVFSKVNSRDKSGQNGDDNVGCCHCDQIKLIHWREGNQKWHQI